MPALDFPASPTVGQMYPDPPLTGIPQYEWDGTAWISANPFGDLILGGDPTDPLGAATKQYVDAGDAALDAAKIGGTFSANDNRLLRTDGIGTKTAQDSVVVVADVTGDLSHATNLGIDIQGTSTNDSAAAGYIGEYVENTRLVAAKTGHGASGSMYEILSIPLTAGDWEVAAHAHFNTANSPTRLQANVSTTTAAAASLDTKGHVVLSATFTSGDPCTLAIAPTRFSLAAPATIYLNSGQIYSTFGSAGGYGHLWARRMR